jgi:hypothetical protein
MYEQDKGFPSKELLSKAPQTSGKAIASLVCGLLSFCFSVLTAIPSLILGFLALGDIRRSQGALRGAKLAISGMVLSLAATALTVAAVYLAVIPAIAAARTAARVAVSSNNLKQIGLGMHNYHDTYNAFPLRGSDEKNYGAGLSWRVRILPYIEQRPLYDRFDFNAPWDSPDNQDLIAEMPEIFKAPGVELEPGKTVYLGVVGGSRFVSGDQGQVAFFDPGGDGVRLHAPVIHEMLDGTSNTIMILEADPSEAAIWTRPDDWEFNTQAPRRGLGGIRMGGFVALFCDGSVDFIRDISDEDLRRALVSRDGQPFQSYTPPSQRSGD